MDTKKWDSVLTVILVGCALVTTAIVVHRNFFASSEASTRQPTLEPVFVEDWRSHLDKGVRLGSASAPVQLIEFADFECPFCASFHATLQTLRDRYPRQVALSYVHYPLSMHRFAEPAARAAECADEQGRFDTMQSRLYEGQKELGLKPWSAYAADAGVTDLAAFESCVTKKDPVPRIVAGQQLAERLDVYGTPTLIINGWKLGRAPGADELDRMVKAILAGKSAVSKD